MTSEPGNVLKFPHKPSADGRYVKFLRYFATTQGKTFSGGAVFGIGFLAGIGSYLAQTIYVENFIDIFRAYK